MNDDTFRYMTTTNTNDLLKIIIKRLDRLIELNENNLNVNKTNMELNKSITKYQTKASKTLLRSMGEPLMHDMDNDLDVEKVMNDLLFSIDEAINEGDKLYDTLNLEDEDEKEDHPLK